MLHVTNGDSTVHGLREAGLGGDTLPWRDVLHEGPVPADLSEDELDEVRADFIAAHGWAPFEEVRAQFVEREVEEGHGVHLVGGRERGPPHATLVIGALTRATSQDPCSARPLGRGP